MKKIITLISLLVYAFSVNALVHASTMDLFANQDMPAMHSCHEVHTSKQAQTQNISCCEFISSDQYSQHHIEFATTDKIAFLHTITNFTPIKVEVVGSEDFVSPIHASP